MAAILKKKKKKKKNLLGKIRYLSYEALKHLIIINIFQPYLTFYAVTISINSMIVIAYS